MSSNVTLSCYNGDRWNDERCFQEPAIYLPAHQPTLILPATAENFHIQVPLTPTLSRGSL